MTKIIKGVQLTAVVLSFENVAIIELSNSSGGVNQLNVEDWVGDWT